MKRGFYRKNLLVLFIISVIVLFTFAGCQSKNSSSTAKAANGKTFSRKNYDPQAMKQKFEDGLKQLVTDGTITQSQSDKIIAALTTNSGRGQASKGSDQKNQSSGTNNGQNRQRFNPLSKLVSDGVITQAQSDAVMQKIRGNSSSSGNHQ